MFRTGSKIKSEPDKIIILISENQVASEGDLKTFDSLRSQR